MARHAVSLVLAAAAGVFFGAISAVAEPVSPKTRKTQVAAGWVEYGWIGAPALEGSAIKLKVKLDTGAQTSSINAAQYRDYSRDGVRRVYFTLTNNEGDEAEFDEPVLRTATIRRAGVERRDRPVIRLKLCLAGFTDDVEFAMAERSQLRYPVLIGRAFLAGKILVDSSATFLASGRCVRRK